MKRNSSLNFLHAPSLGSRFFVRLRQEYRAGTDRLRYTSGLSRGAIALLLAGLARRVTRWKLLKIHDIQVDKIIRG